MKTHRNILEISFFASIVSLILVLVFEKDTKVFQIMLAFMGSSFIAFLLEIPNYSSLQQENKIKLYYSLFDLKFKSIIMKNNIVSYLSDNAIISDKFYEHGIQTINNNMDILKANDRNLYFSKRKNLIKTNVISSLDTAYHNLNQACLRYTTSYIQYQIDNQSQNGVFVNLNSNEMNNQLEIILETINSLLGLLEKEVPLIFSKDLMKDWIIDNSIIVNASNSAR